MGKVPLGQLRFIRCELDLDPTVLRGGLGGFDESRQMDEQGYL